MLGDMAFLWKHRERPGGIGRWFVVWTKRALLFFPLCHLLIRPAFLRLRGAQIGRLVILGRSKIQGHSANLTVGDETSLGRCEIALHDKVIIGRRVVINDGAVLLTASHSLSDPQWRQKKAVITIGDYAWVAANAIILPGVSIGQGAVVGAGAVVRSDVPDFAVVAGNPAIIQGAKRIEALDYSPVLLNAPFEAWIGHEHQNVLSP